jgi:hypothetical protein
MRDAEPQKKFKKLKKKPPMGMPSLTLEGKRAITNAAISQKGSVAFTTWLKNKDIPSLRYFQENIRKYKMGFFKELFEWTRQLAKE